MVPRSGAGIHHLAGCSIERCLLGQLAATVSGLDLRVQSWFSVLVTAAMPVAERSQPDDRMIIASVTVTLAWGCRSVLRTVCPIGGGARWDDWPPLRVRSIGLSRLGALSFATNPHYGNRFSALVVTGDDSDLDVTVYSCGRRSCQRPALGVEAEPGGQRPSVGLGGRQLDHRLRIGMGEGVDADAVADLAALRDGHLGHRTYRHEGIATAGGAKRQH